MGLPAFQTLLDQHSRDVLRFLTGLVGPEQAEDCFQETWLAALRAYPDLQDSSNLRGWVLTVARRKALDQLRTRRREDRRVQRVALTAGGEAHSPAEPSDGRLWARVRELPEKQRIAVAMRYLLDAGYDEIAAALECSPEAARRSVHEGLNRLREEYADV